MKKKIFSNRLKADSKEGKILLSALNGFALCIFLCFIGAFIFFIGDIDFDNAFMFSILAYVMSSFLCGYLTGRNLKEKGMLLGALSGFCFFIMCLIISVFMGPHFDIDTLYKLIISLVSGAIGGICGVNKRNKKKLKPRK